MKPYSSRDGIPRLSLGMTRGRIPRRTLGMTLLQCVHLLDQAFAEICAE